MPGQRDQTAGTLGYLQINGAGGRSVRVMRELLEAFEDTYQAVARVEVEAQRIAESQEWLLRWGPPPRYWASNLVSSVLGDVRRPADTLIVSRVTLNSPGFWEFMGTLNPLEVIRRYLNDRHERKKDRDYRSAAEAERLVIENALASLEVVRRIGELEREFGPDMYMSDAWRRGWIGDVRLPLERLAEFDERGTIDGATARTGIEPPEPPREPDA